MIEIGDADGPGFDPAGLVVDAVPIEGCLVEGEFEAGGVAVGVG